MHSVARNHALIDGNKRTASLAMRVFRGSTASAPVPSRHPSPLPARSSRKSHRTPPMYRSWPSASRPGSPFPDVRRRAVGDMSSSRRPAAMSIRSSRGRPASSASRWNHSASHLSSDCSSPPATASPGAPLTPRRPPPSP
ncbi:hypothetical protein [Streptomyces cinereospinus]|uniref:hypothetical protein n=1 Tax=Streptomyces cinereospinus TaxID=285561 RepID=UPI00361B9BCC